MTLNKEPEEDNEKRKAPRIVFMGTPDFAVASLDALVQANYQVAAVITAPDKPAGRGMSLSVSAVKKYAIDHHLPVLQPEKLKNPEFLDALKALKADVQVVVAFRMLPEVVWNMPPMGTINVHASLLPKYRGAAPINWAIINGEKETGVTTFRLTHQIDTGNILLQETVPIAENDTAGDLHEVLKEAGARLLIRTIEGLMDGSIVEQPQQEATPGGTEVTHAPKIFTETCRINWNKPAGDIRNLIRGLAPFPAAFTHLEGRLIKIYRASIDTSVPGKAPGTYETDLKTWLRFYAADGVVYVEEIQAEGKKKLAITDFLRGFKPGTPRQSTGLA